VDLSGLVEETLNRTYQGGGTELPETMLVQRAHGERSRPAVCFARRGLIATAR